MAEFIISKTREAEYFFCLRSGRNEIILSSEIYRLKQAVRNGIHAVRLSALNDHRFERKNAQGCYYFVLRSANGEALGFSTTYHALRSREEGIEAVKRTAPTAEEIDLCSDDILQVEKIQFVNY